MSDTFRSIFGPRPQVTPATVGGAGSAGGSAQDDASAREVRPDALPGAVIRVLGSGGSGGNAVSRMIHEKVQGVEFIAVNTDVQALYHNPADRKITIGRGTTKGLGAGANPDIG
ncbi:MAG: hypothetical protein AAB728_05175, partial [Patescibacteria group bacterium]